MPINYKKELEAAAKSMILVHEPDLLIKIILRTIVHKVNVTHAGILLHYKDKDTYILSVSRGPTGLKIPKGFTRMDADNALIRYFREHKYREIFDDSLLVDEQAKRALKKRKMGPELRRLLQKALYQMEIYETVACIPSYFREELLGILLLGKKKNSKRFLEEELNFFSALASDAAMAIRNAWLFRELELELDKKKRLFVNTTVALAAAIDAKDHYTHGHTARVTSLSLKIADKLLEKNRNAFDIKFLEYLQFAGVLHDIGKIGIPESILNKEGPLNDEERRRMDEHPVLGVTILEPIKELEDSILGVKYHHERYDGSGYPEGLKASQIPLIAAIIAVADAFDAMTTDRPYRRALTKEQAVQEIKTLSGKQFDPKIASLLVQLHQEAKI
jgi:HD-GYP domain-containing protein (c-di-GMP phosphodiesterase class II)